MFAAGLISDMERMDYNGNPVPKINADFHIHSCWSFDSRSDVASIVKKGRDSGLQYLAITDHCFVIDKDVANLLDRWEKTSGLQWDGPMVLFGTELSIEVPVIMKTLAAGLYGFLDVVSGGVHGFPKYQLYVVTDDNGSYEPYIQKFSRIIEAVGLETLAREYLEITKKAISLNQLDILVHPWDLFVFAGIIDPLLLEMSEELALWAARHNVLIEINNGTFTGVRDSFSNEDYHRTVDFYRNFAGICLLQGAGFAPGSDAHILEDVARFSPVIDIFDPTILTALNSAPEYLLYKKRRNQYVG